MGHDGSNSASVSSSGDHAKVSGVELDGIEDLAGGDVDLDGVVYLDDGVGVPDGSAVTGVQIWDTLGASAGLPINLDEPLLKDSLDLLSGQGVLQTVPDEQSDWQRGILLVGARAWLDGESSTELVTHP